MKQMEGVELHGHYPEIPFAPWWLRMALRFALGRPMDNSIRTNATFWQPATQGYPSRWLRLAGWQRSMVRLSAFVLLLAACVLTAAWLFGAHAWVLRQLAYATGATVLVGAFVGVRVGVRAYGLSLFGVQFVIGTRAWNREKIMPVARATATIIGVDRHHYATARAARRWVHVPLTYREQGGEPVRVTLPHHFHGADDKGKARLVRAVEARLGMRDMVPAWLLEGETMRVELRAAPEPPSLIPFADVRKYYESAEEFTPFYGIAAGGEGLSIGMHSDTPHLAVSAGSGAGKSELIKGVIMQCLRWGWSVIVLDWKEGSQEWCADLDGVRYCRSTEQIHDMGELISEEVEQRKANPSAPRSKTLIICEEWSITADLLSEYWSIMRSTADPEDKKRMPVRSPALTGFKKVIFTGRALGLFEMLVAIRFSARVTGGNADLRESFQVILMARYKQQTVKMLAPGIKPFPRNMPDRLGRWVAVMGEEAVVYQAPLITDAEAREFAMSGIRPPASPFVVLGGDATTQRTYIDTTQEDQLRHDATPVIAATPVAGMKLSDLWEGLEHLGITHNVLRNAARDDHRGDDAFPAPCGGGPTVGYLYPPAEVADWARRRHARIQVEKGRK